MVLEKLLGAMQDECGADNQAALLAECKASVVDLDSAEAAPAMVSIPVDPPLGLLMSMALRVDHGLGVGGDDLAGVDAHSRRLDVAVDDMRRVYEEVTGAGFYKPHLAHLYESIRVPSQKRMAARDD